MTTEIAWSAATLERRLRAAVAEADGAVAVALRREATTVHLGRGPTTAVVEAGVGRLLTVTALAAAVAQRQLGWSTTIEECLPGRTRPSWLSPDTTLQGLLEHGGDTAAVAVKVVEALTGTPYVTAFARLVSQHGMPATSCTGVEAGRPAYCADVGDLATAGHSDAGRDGTAARAGGWREPGACVLRHHDNTLALVGRGATALAARVAQMS